MIPGMNWTVLRVSAEEKVFFHANKLCRDFREDRRTSHSLSFAESLIHKVNGILSRSAMRFYKFVFPTKVVALLQMSAVSRNKKKLERGSVRKT